jgi:hypothetical protein
LQRLDGLDLDEKTRALLLSGNALRFLGEA